MRTWLAESGISIPSLRKDARESVEGWGSIPAGVSRFVPRCSAGGDPVRAESLPGSEGSSSEITFPDGTGIRLQGADPRDIVTVLELWRLLMLPHKEVPICGLESGMSYYMCMTPVDMRGGHRLAVPPGGVRVVRVPHGRRRVRVLRLQPQVREDVCAG